ncbi:hypothetical protein [Pseudomonas indica]|uniref:Uncharacterized protein n=1 Tax=Pseudomonas indica TaxID=137658 RepID=A0A1G9NTW3_9PSED|nr:hypothetical protein [Pseudomonas indica]SDL89829.1 hypothetical protein SAMN05216186_13445 [Pseudomonas indica]
MDRSHRLPTWISVFVLACASLSQPAWAKDAQPCSGELLHSLGRQLGQEGWNVPGESEGRVIAAACKRWPDDPAQTVVAVAYLDSTDDAPPGERSPRLLLSKVEGVSGMLRERYETRLEEDAATEVDSGSLWLDTARYHLAPGVRAFGVVFRSVARGASCPDGGFDDLLTLVVPDAGQLRPVFSTYLSQWTTVKGTSCVSDSGFEMEVSRLTLGIGPNRSNGYADLIVTSRVRNDFEGGNVLRTVSETVRYDGTRYPFEEFSNFWQRQ